MGITATIRRVGGAELEYLMTLQAPVVMSELKFYATAKYPKDDDDLLYIDKAWDGLHYLLAGTREDGDSPARFLLRGGVSIAEDESLYLRFLSPAELFDFHMFLSDLSADELRARFDPEAMTELHIYPSTVWSGDPAEDDTLGYLLSHYERVRDFVRQTALENKGVVIYIG